MPREIQAVQFWQKAVQTLRAVNTAGAAPQLSDQLVIVASLSDIGATSWWAATNLALQGAQDTYVPAFTVGKNNRVRILAISIAARTGSGFSFVLSKASGNAVSLYGARQTGADHTFGFTTGIVLEEGDSLGSAATGNVADTAILFNYFYELIAY